jgi:PAS domain S-box-containing protein
MFEGLVLIREEDGVIVQTNPQFDAMFGYNQGELIGKNIATVNAPVLGNSPEDVAKDIEARVTETGSWSGEVRNIKKDGTPFWCQANVSTLESSEHGAIWIATHQDITERKHLEEALRRRAQELGMLQETLLEITSQHDLPQLLNRIVERAAQLLYARSGGMYLCDPERKEVRCVVSYNTKTDNVGMVLSYGEGAAGFVAQTGKPLIIDDYRSWPGRAAVYEEDEPFGAVVSTPMIWQSRVIGVIHVLDYQGGKRFTQADLGLLTLFANHAAIAVENQSHAENLERMVAERTAKLAESEHQLQLMADSLPALISYVDPEQRYRFNNKVYEEWFGRSPSEIAGRHVREVLGEQGYERIREQLEAALSGVPQAFEFELTLRSGNRQVSSSYIPDLGEDGRVKGVFVLGVDVTERKTMQERLVKTERLAAIGETAAMVGHDLRNPLQAISSAAYLLRKDASFAASERGKEMLDAIENSVGYSDKIVEDLLEYAQDLHLELSESTPRSLTNDALLRLKIPANITVLDSTSEDLKIRVDADKIRRLFVNLIENAIDAMPTGGELRISNDMSNGSLGVKFTDTGRGVPENVLRELWKPLITSKPKGIGLGLAICKRIAEAHGGSIFVESRLGEGATFTVVLPIAPGRVGGKGK